jgi:tRNA pseudouridine38-40 synthase
VRVRLDLGYDGSKFSGWARQPGRRTVQETLETALAIVLRLPEPPRLTVAGRTDAGVHARGQVAHFDVDDASWFGQVNRRPAQNPGDPSAVLLARLAGVLPADVRVRQARVVPAQFDARFAALSRCYSYCIGTACWGVDPLRRHEVWWRAGGLDLAAMNAAAGRLLGEHDFTAYCRARPDASAVRLLRQFIWQQEPDGIVRAVLTADGYCHSMVRALVGAVVAVGAGQRDEWFPVRVLASRTRDPRVNVAPPHGLTLEAVAYPSDEELGERIAQTRRHRVSAREGGERS